MTLVILWGEVGFWAGLTIGIGIFTYGVTYFVVHDIFIHQRFKCLENQIEICKRIRRAHKIHHKNIIKKMESVLECFGFL